MASPNPHELIGLRAPIKRQGISAPMSPKGRPAGSPLHSFLTVDDQNTPIEEITASIPLDLPGRQSFLETSDWVVGLEASGPYTRLLLHHLQSMPYPVYLLSPLQVRRFRQSQSLRKTKTDAARARALAHFLHHQHRQGELKPAGPEKGLRDLARLHEQLTREPVRVQNQFRQTLHFLFPELERRTARFSQALRRVLSVYPSAPALAQADPQHLQALLTQGSGATPALIPLELQEMAFRSLGAPDPAAALHLQHLLALWEALEEQCHEAARTLREETRRRLNPAGFDRVSINSTRRLNPAGRPYLSKPAGATRRPDRSC